MAWIAGEEGGKKEQNRLEKVRPGLGLRRFGELGAQRQGFREQTYRKYLEKCKGLQANWPVRSGDLMTMMMPAATIYGDLTTSRQAVGRALHKHYQISSPKEPDAVNNNSTYGHCSLLLLGLDPSVQQ